MIREPDDPRPMVNPNSEDARPGDWVFRWDPETKNSQMCYLESDGRGGLVEVPIKVAIHPYVPPEEAK